MMNILLALIAYIAILAAIVIFCRGLHSNCNQDCSQGRGCKCDEDDTWKF